MRWLAFLVVAAALAGEAVGQTVDVLSQQTQRALDDGLYSVAEIKARQILKGNPPADTTEQARLWLGRALQGQRKHALAVDAMEPNLKATNAAVQQESRFWLAEALADQGQMDRAAAEYREVLKAGDASVFAARAKLGLAWLLLREGKAAEAETLLGQVESSGDAELAARATLMRGRWLVEQGRAAEAGPLLERVLSGNPAPALAAEARLWSGEVALAAGDAAKALTFFQAVTSTNVAAGTVRWRAWLQQGEAARRLKQWDDAEQALSRVVREVEDESVQLEAVRRLIAMAREEGRVKEMTGRLREMFARDEKNPAAAVCLLAIGEALEQDGQSTAAVAAWKEAVAAVPAGNASRVQALGRAGDALVREGKAEGLALLEQAVKEAPDKASEAEAQVRYGDALFRQGRSEEALAELQKAAANPGGGAVREKAMFNALLCLGRLGRTAEFEAQAAKFSATFPQSVLHERLLDEQAAMLDRAGRGADARERWTALLKQHPDSPLAPAVKLAIAESHLREGNEQAALDVVTPLVQAGSKEPVALRAGYVRLLCLQVLGKESSEALATDLTDLLGRAAGSPLAAEVLFKLGELAYGQEDFAGAQGHFVQLAKEYPASTLRPDALFFAGLAALRRKDAGPAVDLFEQLVKEHPQSAWLPQARLQEAAALRLQAKFTEALAVYDSLVKASTNGVGAAALIGRADCEFRLAADKPERYAKALESYDTALARVKGRADLANEAGWKRAQTLEKLSRPDEALTAYLDVIYGRVLGSGGTNAVAGEYYWLGKSVSDAGQVLEARNDWSGALAVYRMAEKAGGPEAATWRDRRLKLQREHFLYE
jgi:TolA-binding protein